MLVLLLVAVGMMLVLAFSAGGGVSAGVRAGGGVDGGGGLLPVLVRWAHYVPLSPSPGARHSLLTKSNMQSQTVFVTSALASVARPGHRCTKSCSRVGS